VLDTSKVENGKTKQQNCLQLHTSRHLKAKLEQARDLMSHANPSGDLAVVVERAVDLLIQKLKARRFGQKSEFDFELTFRPSMPIRARVQAPAQRAAGQARARRRARTPALKIPHEQRDTRQTQRAKATIRPSRPLTSKLSSSPPHGADRVSEAIERRRKELDFAAPKDLPDR
jgi:hypothetical protein